MSPYDLHDAKTVARINRLSAEEITTLAKALFKDDRVYAVAHRGRRLILRLDGMSCETLGVSHKVRAGVPGNWATALLNVLSKEGGR